MEIFYREEKQGLNKLLKIKLKESVKELPTLCLLLG